MADLTITAASVLPSDNALVLYDYKAAATVTAGQCVYLNSSSPQAWALVDADLATGTTSTSVIGIALNGAAAGQPLAVAIRDDDFTPGATLTTGTTYFASTTAGALCPFADLGAGDYPVAMIVAKSTSKANLNPTAAGAAI